MLRDTSSNTNMRKFDIIIATDSANGMGLNGELPWRCKEELQIFSEKTIGSTIILGRNTIDKLPHLKDRKIFCVSKNTPDLSSSKNEISVFTSFEKALDATHESDKVFVAGGDCLNNYVMNNHPTMVETIHISIFHNKHEVDTYSTINISDFVAKSVTHGKSFDHYELVRTNNGERQYLDLLKHILVDGSNRTGRNGETKSVFGNNMKFDLRNGFPLLTTKRVFWRGVVEELLMFLRGNTDTKVLESTNIFIWKGNTSEEFIKSVDLPYKQGLMGPMYGYQWRHFNSPYNPETGSHDSAGIDQLANVVDLIKTDPTSRRILMTSYNPEQAHEGVLYPCHSIAIQFYVDNGFIDMFCFNRSQDTVLGVPFNIASSALLLSIVAKMTGYTPRFLNMSMGDCHIYKDHYEAAETQLTRTPYVFPNVHIPDMQLTDIPSLKYEDFTVTGYLHHPAIKATMIA